jgi:hypothetical protein
MPEEIMGLILGGIFLITPVVWILTKHQQKMTMLLNGDPSRQPLAPPQEVQRELSALREIVNQQTIALDNLAKSQNEIKAALATREDLQHRVNS